MIKTRSDTGRALMYALALTVLAMVLISIAVVALDDTSGTTTPLLAVAMVVLAAQEGVLLAGLLSEAERVKRTVDRACPRAPPSPPTTPSASATAWPRRWW